MLKITGWLSVKNLMRVHQIKTVINVKENEVCSLCLELVKLQDAERRARHEQHDLKIRELRIAWQPMRTKTQKLSAWCQMVKTYNQCNLIDKELPKSKSSRSKFLRTLVLKKFGLSHKL